MNDEERRLFQRKLRESRDILADCYIELRSKGVDSNAYPLNELREWIQGNYDIDVEFMYEGYLERKDKP